MECFVGPSTATADGKPKTLSPARLGELRTFYENTDVFIIDEVNAMSAEILAQLDETMTQIFNPRRETNKEGDVYPFGNKKMIFLERPMSA